MEDNFKLSVYRICQEQFNNITKYAKATTINFYLGNRNGNLELRIKDDGVGFDTSKTSSGLGLRNIEHRSQLFKGQLTLQSAPGAGCSLQIIFPLS